MDSTSDYETDEPSDSEGVPPKTMIFDLRDEIETAISKKSSRAVSASNPTAEKRALPSKPGDRKGKAIVLPASERTCDTVVQESTAVTWDFKVTKENLHEFISKNEDTGVRVANSVPTIFMVDLRPPVTNNIKEGHCHLMFETDHDPDVFDTAGQLTDDDPCSVRMSVYSSDIGIMGSITEIVNDLKVDAFHVGDESGLSIDRIVSAIKTPVSELWRDRGPGEHELIPIKRKRFREIFEDLSRKVTGQCTQYASIDRLRHSSGTVIDEHSDLAEEEFEMISNRWRARNCNLCKCNLDGADNAGMLYQRCGQ